MLRGALHAGLVACALAAGAHGQERLYLPLDPQAQERLKQVDTLLEREQWDRAVTELDLLLDDGGSLVEREESFVSVRAEARRRLRALPPGGQAAYALVHEGPAERLFAAGARNADPRDLERLIAEHVASPRVEPARNLLISTYLERAEPGAALPHLDALLGLEELPPGERERLYGLQAFALSMLGRVGEVEQALGALPAAAQAAAREVTARVQPAPAALPQGDELAWVRGEAGYYEAEGDARDAWSFPRGDAERVYVHDGSHAQALDLETGRVVWRTPLREAAAGFVRPAGHCRLALAEHQVVCLLPGEEGMVALDRERGTVSWSASLAELKARAKLELPGHFSGRPEVVGDVVALTLVTEHEDKEVHVVGVDARTGQVRWRAFLASQTGGPPPLPYLTQGEGRLVCVTGLGALATLSPQGEVLWVVRYPSQRDKPRERQGPLPGLGPDPQAPPERDPTALVHRGFCWAAPADAKGLFAYRLSTGELGGRIERLETGRILGAGREALVALEKRSLLRVTRAGATALGQLPSPLAGRPWVGAGQAFVPTAQGVARLDLEQGALGEPAAWGELGRGSLWVGGSRLVVAAGRGAYALGLPVEGAATGELRGDLAHPAWRVRDARQAALLAAGEASRPQVEALATDADPEVALRAQEVRGELDRAVRVERWRPLIKDAWVAEVPDLLNRLTHPNPYVRLEALRRLGAIQGDPAVAALLSELLQDPDEEVARTAAIALLTRGDRAGLPVLARALAADGARGRIEALEALASHGDPEDVALVLPALDDPRPPVRAAAAIAALGLDREGAVAGLAERFAREPAEVQLAILRGLGDLGAVRGPALSILIAASEQENDELRLVATTALVNPALGGRRVYAALGARLGDGVREVQRAAAQRLLQVASRGDVLAIPPGGLEAGVKLKDDLARLHVSDIAAQFAHRGGRLTVETLCTLMVDPLDQVRVIENYYSTASWATRLIAAAKERPLRGDEVAAITSLTLRPEAHVRHNGFLALARSPYAPGRARVLVQALGDADEKVRAESASWLLPDGDQPLELDASSTAAILSHLAAPESPGFAPADEVVSRLTHPQLVPLLIANLEHPRAAVRQQAGTRLQEISGQAVVYDPQLAPAVARRDFAVWWWRRTHPDGSLEGLLTDLGAKNPSLRWRSAKEARTLPLPEVRDRVAQVLAKERAAWVQDEQLRALEALLEVDLELPARFTPAERAAAVERALEAWAQARVREAQRRPR